MYEYEGLARVPVTESSAGNIVAMSGLGEISIGDTICAMGAVEPIEFVQISAPTMEMTFSINDSPFAGREGKFVTSRQLRDRLYRETLKDVALRVTDDPDAMDSFIVAGRGEMHMSILIETMRREGYEFQVSPPRVLFAEIDGVKCEPVERVVVDVPSENVGSVIEALGRRKGEALLLCQLRQSVGQTDRIAAARQGAQHPVTGMNEGKLPDGLNHHGGCPPAERRYTDPATAGRSCRSRRGGSLPRSARRRCGFHPRNYNSRRDR